MGGMPAGTGGNLDAGADASGTGGNAGTGGMSGTGGAVGTGGTDAGGSGTGGAPVNLIMDPSAEGAPPGPWTRINQCGTYGQSTLFAHTGTYSAGATGRSMASCGVANGSLPGVDGTYQVSVYALFDPGTTGLTTMPFRLNTRTDCTPMGSTFQTRVTLVDSVTAQAGTWVHITAPITVSTQAPAPNGTAGCPMAGQTISKIYIDIEQASGTTGFPDIYMDDLDVH
jgi:hypothetical protein